jgi:hypothetical protein
VAVLAVQLLTLRALVFLLVVVALVVSVHRLLENPLVQIVLPSQLL